MTHALVRIEYRGRTLDKDKAGVAIITLQISSGTQYRRNFIAMVGDASLVSMAMSFLGATTVLPAFVGTLTESQVVIGAAGGITRGAWLLPQLLVAGYITRMPHRKRVITAAAWLSRPLLLLVALVIYRCVAARPSLTIAVILGLMFTFFMLDAAVSVPWYDHLARTISPTRRGMVVGLAQVLGGVGGIGAGAVVGYLLGDVSPYGYPANYALVYAIAGILVVLAAVSISFISDPDCTPTDGSVPPSPRENLALLPRFLAQDQPFRRMIVVQLLIGFAGVATAFYVLYAQRELGFSLADAGLFVSAQVAGSMLSGFLLGYVQNKLGPLIHIRLQAVLAMVVPALALVAGYASSVPPSVIRWIYVGLFLFLGIYISGSSWPFNNWLLEYASQTRRSIYIGLANTLSALTMLAPVLGGLVVDTISYQAVFVLALGFCTAAVGLSIGLPSTR